MYLSWLTRRLATVRLVGYISDSLGPCVVVQVANCHGLARYALAEKDLGEPATRDDGGAVYGDDDISGAEAHPAGRAAGLDLTDLDSPGYVVLVRDRGCDGVSIGDSEPRIGDSRASQHLLGDMERDVYRHRVEEVLSAAVGRIKADSDAHDLAGLIDERTSDGRARKLRGTAHRDQILYRWTSRHVDFAVFGADPAGEH